MFPAPQRSIMGVWQLALLYNESKNEAGVSKPSVYPTKVYMLAHSKFLLRYGNKTSKCFGVSHGVSSGKPAKF